MNILYRVIPIFWVVVLSSCATHAIVMPRMTYTYPVAEECTYPSASACGAVAFWNDKSISLYLPYQENSFKHRPARYEFTAADKMNETWIGGRANSKHARDVHAHFILVDKGAEDVTADHRESRGMLIVDFPNDDFYKDLAGKSIWLVPAIGWENVKVLRGLFWEGDAKLPESVGIRFSND